MYRPACIPSSGAGLALSFIRGFGGGGGNRGWWLWRGQFEAHLEVHGKLQFFQATEIWVSDWIKNWVLKPGYPRLKGSTIQKNIQYHAVLYHELLCWWHQLTSPPTRENMERSMVAIMVVEICEICCLVASIKWLQSPTQWYFMPSPPHRRSLSSEPLIITIRKGTVFQQKSWTHRCGLRRLADMGCWMLLILIWAGSEEMRYLALPGTACTLHIWGRTCWQGWTTWWHCCQRAVPPKKCHGPRYLEMSQICAFF